MGHPQHTTQDLMFLIHKEVFVENPPPKFITDFNIRKEAEFAALLLKYLVLQPERWRIIWSHAGCSAEEREKSIGDLKVGF
jgi:hypothetical protein